MVPVAREVVGTGALLVLGVDSTWQDWEHRTCCQHRRGSILPREVGDIVAHRDCDKHRDSFEVEEPCMLPFAWVVVVVAAVVHIVADLVAAAVVVGLELPFAERLAPPAARLPWAGDYCSHHGDEAGHRRGCCVDWAAVT